MGDSRPRVVDIPPRIEDIATQVEGSLPQVDDLLTQVEGWIISTAIFRHRENVTPDLPMRHLSSVSRTIHTRFTSWTMESRQIISTMPDHQHDIGESFQEQRTIPIGSARDEGNAATPTDDYTNTGVAPLRVNGFDPHDVHECCPSDHWTVWLALRDHRRTPYHGNTVTRCARQTHALLHRLRSCCPHGDEGECHGHYQKNKRPDEVHGYAAHHPLNIKHDSRGVTTSSVA